MRPAGSGLGRWGGELLHDGGLVMDTTPQSPKEDNVLLPVQDIAGVRVPDYVPVQAVRCSMLSCGHSRATEFHLDSYMPRESLKSCVRTKACKVNKVCTCVGFPSRGTGSGLFPCTECHV